MTSSTDKAEPTKSESAQDDFSQADQPEESHSSDINTPKASPIENEAPLDDILDLSETSSVINDSDNPLSQVEEINLAKLPSMNICESDKISDLHSSIDQMEALFALKLRSKHFSRALTIIYSLQSSLDFEKGGEIADNLFQTYEFARQMIIGSIKDMDETGPKRALALLVEIREAWAQMGEQLSDEK